MILVSLQLTWSPSLMTIKTLQDWGALQQHQRSAANSSKQVPTWQQLSTQYYLKEAGQCTQVYFANTSSGNSFKIFPRFLQTRTLELYFFSGLNNICSKNANTSLQGSQNPKNESLIIMDGPIQVGYKAKCIHLSYLLNSEYA